MKTSNKIKTRESHSDWVAALLCPRCGAELLHQRKIDVFARAEDHDETLIQVANVDSDIPTIRIDDPAAENKGNPSSRRDGIAIRFDCEGCGESDDESFIELTIAQHKGSTEIGWRYSDGKSD